MVWGNGKERGLFSLSEVAVVEVNKMKLCKIASNLLFCAGFQSSDCR